MKGEQIGEIVELEVFEAACACEALEEYRDDSPYPSALLLGFTNRRRPIHLVCAHDDVDDR